MAKPVITREIKIIGLIIIGRIEAAAIDQFTSIRVILPQERPLWPEALYLISHKSRQGYTLEAPSDFPLPARVAALVAAVNAALAN